MKENFAMEEALFSFKLLLPPAAVARSGSQGSCDPGAKTLFT